MSTVVDPLSSLMHTAGSAGGTGAATGGNSATKDDFLRLLVAQLSHQDPLQPQDNSAFVAELAQFSSLEQQAQTNQQLADIATGQIAAQRVSYAGFIGKTLSSKSDTVTLSGQGAPALAGHLEGNAAKVQLVVSDVTGKALRTIDLGAQPAGPLAIDWKGTDDKGKPLPAGTYQIALNATDAKGATISGYVAVQGVVTGLDFTAQGTRFRVGGAVVDPADIVSIN